MTGTVLADTSVWIDHFRRGNARLERLLEEGEVVLHPFVLGELACGKIGRRREVLGLLGTLAQVVHLEDDEVMTFLERRRLYGRGLGWVDVHLLASAVVSDVRLFTRDRRLARAAEALGRSAF